MKGLLDRIDFAFQVNYHSAGEWLLYAEGWQTGTPTADDPIYFALSGNLDEPAIPGFHPGLSSDVLYVTNGETTDYAHASAGTLAWTPELSEGCPGCGFVFPDDEALVQAEFEKNLPFALSVARVGVDPDDPESSLGIETKPFYLESDDPYKEGLPGANFAFEYSYGDPQPVAGARQASLGAVMVKYRINGGRGAERADVRVGGRRAVHAGDVYYHEMRGAVTGTSPGDSRRGLVRGRRRAQRLVHLPGRLRDRQPRPGRGGRGLLGRLAARRRRARTTCSTTSTPSRTTAPADVYDVDARGRIAPDHLGVLGHYDAVHLVHGRRHRDPQAGLGAAATPTGSRWTRCSRREPS